MVITPTLAPPGAQCHKAREKLCSFPTVCSHCRFN